MSKFYETENTWTINDDRFFNDDNGDGVIISNN